MNATEYTRDIKVSDLEWVALQKIRLLLEKGYGNFLLKARDHRVDEMEITLRQDAKDLAKLQQKQA